uniref:Protein kinase domain-containing protein n=1 Tax=Sexangularia sp. CB-2014 TaxID=1486929 RepID=A0A7S1VCF6_9EUKA
MLILFSAFILYSLAATNTDCTSATQIALDEIVSGDFGEVVDYPTTQVNYGQNFAENPQNAGPGLYYYLPVGSIPSEAYYVSVTTCVPGTSPSDGYQLSTMITVLDNTTADWSSFCGTSNVLTQRGQFLDSIYPYNYVDYECQFGSERSEGIFYYSFKDARDLVFLVQPRPASGGAPFSFQVQAWSSDVVWAESRNYTPAYFYKDRCATYSTDDGSCASELGCRVTDRSYNCIAKDLSPFVLCHELENANDCENTGGFGNYGYCEWDDGRCVYAPTVCDRQFYPGTPQYGCDEVETYSYVYLDSRDAQCFVDWRGGDWYSSSNQPFCSRSTGFNPELDATLTSSECGNLTCPSGEHCAYVTYGTQYKRRAVCVCDDVTRRSAPGTTPKFGCAEAPLRNRFGPGPVLGRFNGTFHSTMDTKCGVLDAGLGSTTSHGTVGCVSSCLAEEGQHPFSIEFLPDGGMVFSVQPESGSYYYEDKRTISSNDRTAQFFAPPYGLTFSATLASPVSVAQRDQFAQGEAITVRYNVVRNEVIGTYSTSRSTDIILTDDPCSTFKTSAECQVVRGCEYCEALSVCYNIGDNFDPSPTPFIRPEYYESVPCYSGGGRHTGVPSGEWWLSGVETKALCVSMQRDGDALRIGVGSLRDGFVTDLSNFSSFCPTVVANSELDLSTPSSTCTGGIAKDVRDSYYSYYSSNDYPPETFGPAVVDAPLSATSVAHVSCVEGSSCEIGVYPPESACTGCPCTELSDDPNCIDEQGAGVAFGEAGCFDARCPGDGSADSLCGEFVQPTANRVTTQLRFCDPVRATHIHSCNWISFSSTSASTARYPSLSVGFDCSSSPFATNCSEANQLNAYCSVEGLVIKRVGQYIPIVGTDKQYLRAHAKDTQYVSFESIPSFGKIVLYSQCVDEECARTKEPRSCLATDTVPKRLVGRPRDTEPSIVCPQGMAIGQVVSYKLEEHVWLFVPDEGLTNETQPEYLVYELNGTHYGMVVGIGNIDESASFILPNFGEDTVKEQLKDEGSPLTIIVAIVASILAVLLMIAVVQQCRAQQAQRAALLERSVNKSIGGTQEMNSMKTMESGRGGNTTANLGALINVDEEKSPLDPKYIIKPSDLQKDKKIGEGGYGYVYRGEWRDMEVAIKEVRGTDPEVVDMLMLEARAAIDLRPHENIVTLYGVCLEPFSIVTAFCSKGSLDDMLYGDNPVEFSDSETKRLLVGIASGISHLHHEGIIHRDLAARNILVNETGVPMVADFGMSRKDETAMEGTENQTKTTVGPIRWMAPEQLDAQLYSAYSDVWSFGVILYEVYAREVPWKKHSNMKAAQLVLNEHNLAEEQYRPKSVKPVVLKVMQACFAFESSRRPKMTWCVKKLNKDWDKEDGGDDFRRAVVQREEDGGIYAAPPTKKGLPKASAPARTTEGTYDAPSVARQSTSTSSRMSIARGKQTSAAKAETPYDAPPESDDKQTEEAGGLYEAPVAKAAPPAAAEEAGDTYDVPSISGGDTGPVEEDGGLYEAPVKQ